MNTIKIFSLAFFTFGVNFGLFSQDYSNVSYGPETRQFLDIYIAPSLCPTPVYFDAHGNGGTTNMPNSIIDSLKNNGISIVAWESLKSVNTPSEVQTGWDDAQLMFDWVKANANTYNFDTTNLIIGGSSRGSVISWKYSHSQDPNIKGLYMYNALPNGAWQFPNTWYPPDDVGVNSPPIFFVYRYEPGVTFDSHDPNNGIIIMDRYDSLGIGNRDTLIHSIEYSGNNDKYQFLVDFALSVLEPCSTVGLSELEINENSIEIYPNPVSGQFTIGGELNLYKIEILNATGQIYQTLNTAENSYTIDISNLPIGLYLVRVQNLNNNLITVQKILKE